MVLTNKGAAALAKWRQAHGYSYFDAAMQLDLTPESVRKYEGGSSPSRRNALKLRERLDIPVDAWDVPAEEAPVQGE